MPNPRKPRVRASYHFGVQWIADNDEPGVLDENEVAGFATTMLLADLFRKPTEEVAEAVVLARLKDEES